MHSCNKKLAVVSVKNKLDDYSAALKFLYELQKLGMKFGLDNIKKLCAFLGNPELKYPTIHIAGTNGKGSTAAMIASILTASGYRTGLYTSPHLVDFSERIRIDGIPISASDLVEYVKLLRPQIVKASATFFEATTAITFKYFYDKNVDVAVIETGLGGRLDSTNIIQPEVSLITTIGFDHMEQLGNTIQKITREKAGIIKKNIPCITTVRDIQPLRIIRDVARKNKSELIEVGKVTSFELIETNLDHQVVSVFLRDVKIENMRIGLIGSFQKDNILLSIVTTKYLRDNKGFSRINFKTIKSGLRNVRKNSGLRGRLEVLNKNPVIIGDVAHNEQAFTELTRTLLKLGIRDVVTVFGMMNDKEIDSVIPHLKKISRILIACAPRTERALKSKRIIDKCRLAEISCINGESVAEGLNIAKIHSRGEIPILICGSHYVLGEAIIALNKV